MKENNDNFKIIEDTEEMHKNIINNLMDTIIVLDLKGKFLYVSSQFYDISGFKPEEVIGKSGFKFMHPDDIQKAVEVLKDAIEQKTKVQIEYRTIHKKGHYLDVVVRGRIVKMGGDDRIFAIVRDISEQKRSEQKLKESENKYRQLIEDSLLGVWVIDEDANTSLVNSSMTKILGYPVEEMIGRSIYSYMEDEEQDKTKLALEKRKHGISEERDVEMIHKNGKRVYLKIRATPIFDKQGKYKGTQAFLTDITQRKLAELKSLKSERNFRSIFESIPIGLHVYKLNSDGDLIFVNANPPADRILNIDNKQFIGKTIEEAFPPLINTDVPKRYKKIAKEGGNWKWDQFNYQDKKIQGAYEVFAFQTTPRSMVTSFHDITGRIEAENKIRESEKKYRQLIEDSLEGVWVIDENAYTTLVNSSMAKLLGYEVEEMIGKNIFDFTLPEDLENTKNTLKRRKKGVKEEIEKRFIRKDGTEVVTRLSASPIFEGNNTYKGAIAFVSDITERKRTEKLLKESEEKYSHLFKSSPYSIIIGDMTGTIIDCNFVMDEITGYTRSDIIGKSMLDVPMFPREYLPIVMKDFQTMLKGDIPKPNELQIIRKNGSLVWVQPSASIFKLKDKSYFQIIMQDINERKISEEKIKESEEKFRNIAEQSFMGIMVIQDGLFKYFNEKASEINGYSMDEIRKWKSNEFAKILHPEDREFVMEQAAKKQTGDRDVVNNYQTRIIRKDGATRWLDLFSKTINYEGFTADLVMNIDITDKIQADQSLKESEEKFRTLFEIAPASITMLDLNGNIVLCNQKFCDLHGVKNLELLEGRNIRDFFIESDLPKLRESMELSLEGKSRDLNQYTMLREDGTQFPAEAISIGIKDKNGEVIGLIGVAQDITDRENAAQELRESEEKFRTIAEQSFMGVLIIQDNKIEYVNKALLDIFNFSEKDINNWSKKDLINLINPNDLQFLRDYRNKLRQGKPNVKPYYSYQVFTKSGKEKWIDQFSKEINYKGRTAELVTIMDITEKKEAEQELVKLNSLKSELMRRTSHELKTPLVSIKGYADLLLNVHKENLDDYILASVVEIKQGCERLESLIQDILNAAELESGTVQIKKVEDDLAFFIKLSIRELKGLARLRNQTVSSNIKNKLITSFEPEQIHQVVSNLINNAIKYTPPDGTIDIDSEIIDGFIKISVKDSGIGITEEEKERLFTQFGKIERYGQGLDIISEGSGLGLYISKKVIELHGGKLWVESQGRNKGSIFSFTLPIIQ